MDAYRWAQRRRIIRDALALAERERDRALAREQLRLVARYEAIILCAEEALGVLDRLDAAEEDEPRP